VIKPRLGSPFHSLQRSGDKGICYFEMEKKCFHAYAKANVVIKVCPLPSVHPKLKYAHCEVKRGMVWLQPNPVSLTDNVAFPAGGSLNSKPF